MNKKQSKSTFGIILSTLAWLYFSLAVVGTALYALHHHQKVKYELAKANTEIIKEHNIMASKHIELLKAHELLQDSLDAATRKYNQGIIDLGTTDLDVKELHAGLSEMRLDRDTAVAEVKLERESWNKAWQTQVDKNKKLQDQILALKQGQKSVEDFRALVVTQQAQEIVLLESKITRLNDDLAKEQQKVRRLEDNLATRKGRSQATASEDERGPLNESDQPRPSLEDETKIVDEV